MSLIIRRRRGLISVIGLLLAERSGFNTRYPLKPETFRPVPHLPPAPAG